MKDIYTIKGPLNLELLDNDIIMMSAVLSMILLFIIATIIWYLNSLKATQETIEKINSIKSKYIMSLQGLNPEEHDIFLKINYLIRAFLEEYDILPGSIRMTSKQIKKHARDNEELKDFVDECERFEFSNKSHTMSDIDNVRQKAIYIIKKI